MKLFETASGILINPSCVAMISSYQPEGKAVAAFHFLGGKVHEAIFDSIDCAEAEINNFKVHCDNTIQLQSEE